MARLRGTHHFSTLKHGDWTQSASHVAGAGTGTAGTPVALMTSGTYTEGAANQRIVSPGGDSVIELAIMERVISFGGTVKDPTLIGKALRGTSLQTDQQFLTFLVANDFGLAKTLTDAWIKTLSLSQGNRNAGLMASFEVWALRETTGTYAAQGTSSGWGPMQGAHLTTATVDGSAINELLTFDLNLDNGFGWDDNLEVAASGDELEHVDFLCPVEETITGTITAGAPLADTGTKIGELDCNLDIDIVFVYTVGAHNLTLTLTDLYATQRAHTLAPGSDKYVWTLGFEAALAQGSLTVAIT